MPKIKHIVVMIALVALGLLLGCGSGDKGPVGRVSPQELVSGTSGTGGPGGGPGGGGGGNGACVASGTCVNNLDATSCSAGGGQLHTGTTCQALGYTTCSTYQGYEYCY